MLGNVQYWQHLAMFSSFFFFFLGKAQYLQSLAGATADKDICIRSENHLISKLNLNEKQIREEMSRNINQLKNIDQLKISRTKMKNKNKFRPQEKT